MVEYVSRRWKAHAPSGGGARRSSDGPSLILLQYCSALPSSLEFRAIHQFLIGAIPRTRF
jgi:hypothetical protein